MRFNMVGIYPRSLRLLLTAPFVSADRKTQVNVSFELVFDLNNPFAFLTDLLPYSLYLLYFNLERYHGLVK